MSIFHSIIHSIFPARSSDQPAVPPLFTVSPVRRAHSAWLYLWPFQSRKTLVSTAILLGGGSVAVALVILLWVEPGALPWALGGGLIGGMYFGPYRALPAQITVTTRSEARHLVDDVKQLVLRLGYEVGVPTGEAGHVHYRHKWHSKPGIWASSDEQNIDLRCHDHQIELHGPVNAIEWLHATLYNRLLKQMLEG